MTIFPYAFTQFWFYEFYQMGVPIFMPSLETLPLYINQDYPRHSHAIRTGHTPVHPYDPFTDYHNLNALRYWAKFTAYIHFPHVQYFSSIVVLINMLMADAEHFTALSRKMRTFTQTLLVKNAHLWRHGLAKVLSAPHTYADN